MDKRVRYGQTCTVWTNVYSMDKRVQYGQTCTVWTNVYSMDRHVQYGQTCTVWTNVYSMDKRVQYGQTCTVWTNVYGMDNHVVWINMYSMLKRVQYGQTFMWGKYINGLDNSDQILGTNNFLYKYLPWWKTLFFARVNISNVSNVYILIKFHENNYPDNESLKSSERYSTINFELINNILQPVISIMPLFWRVFHIEWTCKLGRNTKL